MAGDEVRFYAVERRYTAAHPFLTVHSFEDAMQMDDWIQAAAKRGDAHVKREELGVARSEMAALFQAYGRRPGVNTVVRHSRMSASAPAPARTPASQWVNLEIPKLKADGTPSITAMTGEHAGKLRIELPGGIEPAPSAKGVVDISHGWFVVRNAERTPVMEGGQQVGWRHGQVKSLRGSTCYEIGFPETGRDGKPWEVHVHLDGDRPMTAAVELRVLKRALDDAASKERQAYVSPPTPAPARKGADRSPGRASPGADIEAARRSASRQDGQETRRQREMAR